MKKFLFSTYIKVFAVILFLASLTLGVLSAVRGVELKYAEQRNEEEGFIYEFGTSMEDCYYMRQLVGLPDMSIHGVWYNYTEFFQKKGPEEAEAKVLMELERRLKALPLEHLEYYVNFKGNVFSSEGLTDPAAITNGLYLYYAMDKAGNWEFHSGRPSYRANTFYTYGDEVIEFAPLILATRIRPEYVERISLLWDKQETILYTAGTRIVICALGLLLSLIYLICVCGRDGKDNRKASWVDLIWAEFHLAAIGAIAYGALYFSPIIVEEAIFRWDFPIYGAYLILSLLMPLAGGLILCSLLSMLRNLKAGMFGKRCGVCILLKFLLILLKKLLIALWKGCKAFGRGLKSCGKTLISARKTTFTLIQIGILLAYTIVTITIVAISIEKGPGILLFLLPLYGFGAYLIARKGKDLEEIKKGASRIRNGDLTHQVPEPKATYFKALTEDINHIAKGLDNSLSARMKAERMKTELITNVSHDLKTPLTSIITYTELLSRVEGLPEEAEDYIRIIGDKSQRLKSLTQDLFDISKVQSGNEEVCWEVLDAALLLEQSLAEETGGTPGDATPFCLKAQENLSFMGDGRKLSRVLGNLIQNATKYAMAGTRIFLSAYEQGDRVFMECKNTSSYPLDFTPEEILGRFVRGDSSRSTEGNGLGLPIAKSYTELCGGEFQLVLDGDLFKVLLSFPKAQ